jgi:hypothetical protein
VTNDKAAATFHPLTGPGLVTLEEALAELASTILADSPLRCGWGAEAHDEPAVWVLERARPCGCPDPRVTPPVLTCIDCAAAHPAGTSAPQSARCSECGRINAVTIVGRRPITEGDLP